MMWGSGAAMRFVLFGGLGLLVAAIVISASLQASQPDRAGHVAAIKAYNTASEVGAIFSQDPTAVNALTNQGNINAIAVGQDGLNNPVTVGIQTQVVNGSYVVTGTAPNGTTYAARTALRAAGAPNGATSVAR